MSMMHDSSAWDPPSVPRQPGVVTWFRVYLVAMLLVYVLLAAFGGIMVAMPDLMVDPDASVGSNRPADATEAMIMGAVYLVMGLVLAVGFVVPLLLPRGKVAWVWSLVTICLGLTSPCCMPATIPLLIFWLRQDTRDWYRGDADQAVTGEGWDQA